MPQNKYPPDRDDSKTKENIVEHVSYFNVLIQSISNINAAIMQEKDARDAALNLLTDLPDNWSKEIEDKIMKETEQYDKVVAAQSKYLVKGTTQEEKLKAKEKINIAARNYSRNVKKIVISLMQDKNILYQTRKQVEQGGLSLWQLGETDEEDE